jgi:hypothetical protein
MTELEAYYYERDRWHILDHAADHSGEIYQWCFEQFGDQAWVSTTKPEGRWAWGIFKVRFRDENDLIWFKLRWGHE